MNHETTEGLIPAYALGALDAGEIDLLKTHLKGCASCRALLTDYQAIGSDLLFAVPTVATPVGLGEDLRRRIRSASTPAGSRFTWSGFLRKPAFAFAALAVSLALLLVTNLYWAGRMSRVEQQAALLTGLSQAQAIPLQADTPTNYASGVLYVHKGARTALLCVYDLLPLPNNKIYQAWLIQGERRDNAGVFQVTAQGFGILLLNASRPLEEYDALGITVEPAAGSLIPTSPHVIGGSL